jgi:hypothetical protein
MGTYGNDIDFLKKHHVEVLELASDDGLSRIAVAPNYQGRVMTSTAGGYSGDSYGWINYRLIASEIVDPLVNHVGGEDRIWLGPEGGPFSFYFMKGDEQNFDNWFVPKAIDSERFDIAESSASTIVFAKKTVLPNASGNLFNIGIERKVSILSKNDVEKQLTVEIPLDVKMIAFQSENTIINNGQEVWTKQTGLPSIWMLGMFNPTPTTTVFIPYREDGEGTIVNTGYFEKVTPDRMVIKNGILFFKIDGTYRTKIGIPATRAKALCGSYDTEKNVVTLVWFNLPEHPADYVNSRWGNQDEPFNGDVVNSYNDGPVADGSVMGPFFEIETSSPGAALSPGQSLKHMVMTVHLQGEKNQLNRIVQALFATDLEEISSIFR